MDINLRHISKTFIKQDDVFDCGIAALRSIIRYYGGEVSQEQLRLMSGTDLQGTTLLGLYQCAGYFGLQPEGVEISIEYISSAKVPFIIHTTLYNGLSHFMVYYGAGIDVGLKRDQHLLGDPALGLNYMDTEHLMTIWKSGAALLVDPGVDFVNKSAYNSKRRRWLINAISTHQNLLVTVLLLSFFITVLGLSLTMFSQKLIDNILPKHNFKNLVMGLVFLSIVLILRNFLSFIRTYFLGRYSFDFQRSFTGNFITGLFNKPTLFFMQFTTGEIVSRLSDAMKIQKVIVYFAAILVIDIWFVLTALVYLANLSPLIAGIVTLFVPILILLARNYSNPVYQANKKIISEYNLTENQFIEFIGGHPVIREFNREEHFILTLKNTLTKFLKENYSLTIKINKYQFLTDFVNAFFYISVLSVASFLVFNKTLTIGKLIAIFSIQASLGISFQRLSQSLIIILEGSASADKMFNLIDTANESNSRPPVNIGSLTSIRIHKLFFRFPGRKLIFNGISLAIKKGQITGITGRSGSGKSLLLQLIIGNFKPESGEIIFTLDELDYDILLDWRCLIGHVSQDVFIFTGTVLENISLDYSGLNSEQVKILCRDLGFEKRILMLPLGYDTIIGKNNFQLSGGQKQMIGIARALFKKPQILLLDEATSSMDIDLENNVKNKMGDMKHELAIVWVTHNPNPDSFCDVVFQLG